MNSSVGRRVYSRDELLAVKWSKSGGSNSVPAWKCFRRCHAGAKIKTRRYKSCLLSVIMMGMSTLYPTKLMSWRNWWLPGKHTMSAASCALLNQNISDSCMDLPGFTLIHSDRDAKASGKIKVGDWLYLWIRNGVILFILLSKRKCVARHLTIGKSWSKTILFSKIIQSYLNNP